MCSWLVLWGLHKLTRSRSCCRAQGSYCPGGGPLYSCPAGSTTTATGATSAAQCQVSAQSLVFTLVPGGNNYATCDGTYTLDPRTINGKPLYINSPGSRFLAWNTGAWVITGTQWLAGILASQGYFGAFQANNGNTNVMQGWANYVVTVGGPAPGYYLNNGVATICPLVSE